MQFTEEKDENERQNANYPYVSSVGSTKQNITTTKTTTKTKLNFWQKEGHELKNAHIIQKLNEHILKFDRLDCADEDGWVLGNFQVCRLSYQVNDDIQCKTGKHATCRWGRKVHLFWI